MYYAVKTRKGARVRNSKQFEVANADTCSKRRKIILNQGTMLTTKHGYASTVLGTRKGKSVDRKMRRVRVAFRTTS